MLTVVDVFSREALAIEVGQRLRQRMAHGTDNFRCHFDVRSPRCHRAAHYEVGRVGVGAAMLPRLAELLDLSFDEILTGQPTVRIPGKRGPASRIEQQLDTIAKLPKGEQRFVSKMLDSVLAQHGQEATAA